MSLNELDLVGGYNICIRGVVVLVLKSKKLTTACTCILQIIYLWFSYFCVNEDYPGAGRQAISASPDI